ncbi:MAG: glycogen debranching enzyme N-terminal domain-containing protein, partial [Candidatus Geothermarchaeales archaeon]
MKDGALRVPWHHLHRLSEALATEWILTNGLGGYSSSTVIGANARKYHGLLVASLEPPVDLWMALSKLDEKLVVGRDHYELSTNMYQDVGPHPKGFLHQREFLMDPLPTFQYEAGRVLITKSMMLKSGDNLSLTTYRIQNPTQNDVELRVSPLVAVRPNNTTSSGKDPIEQSVDRGSLILHRPDEGPVLGLLSREMKLTQSSLWIEGVFYPTDHARRED